MLTVSGIGPDISTRTLSFVWDVQCTQNLISLFMQRMKMLSLPLLCAIQQDKEYELAACFWPSVASPSARKAKTVASHSAVEGHTEAGTLEWLVSNWISKVEIRLLVALILLLLFFLVWFSSRCLAPVRHCSRLTFPLGLWPFWEQMFLHTVLQDQSSQGNPEKGFVDSSTWERTQLPSNLTCAPASPEAHVKS